ncbi:MAG: glycosyltransferase family 9 protein [Gammaproteobacteria bacterium]|nr:glycosyltransferase family 9 protein [Gammaproteobacteria bacterium]
MNIRIWLERGGWVSRHAREKAAQLEYEQVKTIAVIRHAAMGDMVLTRPFLLELRKHFPNAKITLSLVSNYTRGAPEDLADRIHTVYGSDRKDVSKREQVKQLKALGHHDLIFDLAATSRSFWLCLLNSAGLKIGFPYHQFQRRLIYDAAVLRSDMKFEAETLLDMLNLLSLKTDYPLHFAMPGKPMQRKRPYLVYFTSASTSNKCWSATHFSELISQLSDQYSEHEHIVLEGIAEWESIDGVMRGLQDKQNVTPLQLANIDETFSLLMGAHLLVSNDTGIRHMAIASEIPTVGIFFHTIPFRYWPRFGLHDAVFNSDGSPPEVESVLNSVNKIMSAS